MSNARWLAAERLMPKLAEPLTVLWAWPGGGAQEWLEALSRAPQARLLDRSRLEAEVSALKAGEVGLLQDVPARLGNIIETLSPGARVVVAGSPRPELGAIPQQTFTPRDLTLDLQQLEAAAEQIAPGAFSHQELTEIHAKTGGWLKPALFLIHASKRCGDGRVEVDLGDFLEASILGSLDDFERRVLAEVLIASSGEEVIAMKVWRRFYLDQPQKLSALERLVSSWGLLGEQAPPLAAGIFAGEAGDEQALLKRLAGAAATLGIGELASRALTRAGELKAAARFHVNPADTRHTAVYQLRLLGPPSVARVDATGAEQEIHWRLRRSLLAVARLALAPDRRLPRDELIEALWPESSVDHVRRNFHPTLSAARRALGGGRAGGLVQRHGIYALDPAAEWHLDVEEFESHLSRASLEETHPARALAELESAWRLYRGPLLDSFDAEWLEEPRRLQHEHYLDMLRRLGDLARSEGRETLALDAYRRLLLEEPFEERIHLDLMGIYGRRGRRDLVRRQFVHLQELLKDIHAEPEEETVERYHQLMR